MSSVDCLPSDPLVRASVLRVIDAADAAELSWVSRPIVLIDAERQRTNRRFGRWILVPWSVALIGGVGVSAVLGNAKVGKWIFFGG